MAYTVSVITAGDIPHNRINIFFISAPSFFYVTILTLEITVLLMMETYIFYFSPVSLKFFLLLLLFHNLVIHPLQHKDNGIYGIVKLFFDKFEKLL